MPAIAKVLITLTMVGMLGVVVMDMDETVASFQRYGPATGIIVEREPAEIDGVVTVDCSNGACDCTGAACGD